MLLLLAAACAVQLGRGVAGAKLVRSLAPISRVPGTRVQIRWPEGGAAAMTVEGVAPLGGVRTGRVLPLASVTKLVTALVVLKAHPLALGQSGPGITFTAADAIAYQRDLAQDQSVLKVAAGETLTELQALEGMLIPSADNIARVLAVWTAGSESLFVREMNAEAGALGLHGVHLVGPSGLNPGSVGTAAAMVKLGAVAMANPVLRQIVAMPSVTLPVAGTVANYDSVLGQHGIVGIKTGSTGAAGGNFVFAARHRVAGVPVTTVGAVLDARGADPLQTALSEATALAAAAAAAIRWVAVLPAGTLVLTVKSGWGPPVQARTARVLGIVAVAGQRLRLRLRLVAGAWRGAVNGIVAGQLLGHVDLRYGGQRVSVPVTAARSLGRPSLLYRLLRI